LILNLRVAALLWLAALEDDHCSDGVASLDVRDIEAFDARRQCAQAKQIAHLAQPRHGALLAVEPLQPQFFEFLARVLFRQFDETTLFAALWRVQCDFAPRFLRQPLLDHCRFIERRRQQ
jgi:hypothetical protein